MNIPRMQQGSVGCDGATVPSPRGNSPKPEIPNDGNSLEPDARVRVKLELTEAFEVKREPQDEYHTPRQDDRYDRKPIVPLKFDGNPELAGQCQPMQHQGYRHTTNIPNSYVFPHFYGPQTMLPPSFPAARPSPDRPMGKIEEHDREHERYRVAVSGVHGDGGAFLHHEPHRYEIGDYHHGKPPGYPGMPYAAFRPSMQHRSTYGHQNNTGYMATQYQNRQRKWSGAALRGLHPAMPVSLLRTDIGSFQRVTVTLVLTFDKFRGKIQRSLSRAR